MSNYLWVYILGILSFSSLFIFLISFGKDHRYIKKLKLNKLSYLPNFLLIVFSILDVSLIIYLFMILKEQIGVFQ